MPRLFSLPQAMVGTVIGGPWLGPIFLSVNYHRLGRNGDRNILLFVAVFGSVASYGTSVIATFKAGRTFESTFLTEHVAAGGRMGSRWTVAFWSAAVPVFIVVLVVFSEPVVVIG